MKMILKIRISNLLVASWNILTPLKMIKLKIKFFINLKK